MLVRLSSKGQVVIPKAVRQTLRLTPGTELRIEVVEQKVVLEPVTSGSPIDALYGKYAEYDLLGALEQEHQQEVQNDRTVRA